MGDPLIVVDGLAKDYGKGRGLFGVSFAVEPGEAMGFLGANGAGKTVTMRMLMGFIKPDGGRASIAGADCFRDGARIQGGVGYLPGEVSCPPDMRGGDFISFVAKMTGRGDREGIGELIERFDLDASAKIGRMSKGTKQKVAIVCAFMGHPRVLLLDEPTSGLDPLMQERFLELLREERERGATVLLSSHLFPEVERSCDNVAFIRAGRLRGIERMNRLAQAKRRAYVVTFADAAERDRYESGRHDGQRVSLCAASRASLRIEVLGDVGGMVRDLARYNVVDLAVQEQTLEEMFMHVYEGPSCEEPFAREDETASEKASGCGSERR